MPLVLRGSKGAKLNATEHDANLTYLEALAQNGGLESLKNLGDRVIPYVENGSVQGIPLAETDVATQYDIDFGTETGVEITPRTLRNRRLPGAAIPPVSNRLAWEWPGVGEGLDDRPNYRNSFVSANTTLAWNDLPAHKEGLYDAGAWFITNTSGSNVTISLGKSGSEEIALWQTGVSNATLAAGATLKVEWESWPTTTPRIVCRHYTATQQTIFDVVGFDVNAAGSPHTFAAHEAPAADGTKWVIVGAFLNLTNALAAAPPIPTGGGWTAIPGASAFVNVSGNRMGIAFASKYAASAAETWGTINTTEVQHVCSWVIRVNPAPTLVTDLFGNYDDEQNNASDTSVPWGGLTLPAASRVLVAVCSPAISTLAHHVPRAGFQAYKARSASTFSGNCGCGYSDIVTSWASDSSTFGANTRSMVGSLQMKDPSTV